MAKFEELTILTEIEDIEKRDTNISLWAVSFSDRNGRRPTDQEAAMYVIKLKKQLENIRNIKHG